MSVRRHDLDWGVMEEESRAVAFREVVFKGVGRHVGFAAAVNRPSPRRAKPAGLGGGVDRGVAATDHRHPCADRDLVERIGVDLLNESERVDDLGQIFARNAQSLAVAETDADENGVEFFRALRA